MYANTGDVSNRHLKAFVITATGEQSLELGDDIGKLTLRARVLPNETNLQALLDHLGCNATAAGNPEWQAIRLEYWQSTFDVETLSITSRQLWTGSVNVC